MPNTTGDFWVVKLGGSLLKLPDLQERLEQALVPLLQNTLLIVGGGPAADRVRQWDAVHNLSASTAHWLAIRAMDFNREVVLKILPAAVAVRSRKEADSAWRNGDIPMLQVADWLRDVDETAGKSLPHSWDVTSDSIAAWIAIRWNAAGLLLLKSTDWESGRSDLVDAYFPSLAPRIPEIRWCNLRRHSLEINRMD